MASQRFATFSPVAIAAIDSLPLPILATAVVIHMQRSDGGKTLRRLDDVHAAADLDLAYLHAFMGAARPSSSRTRRCRRPAERRTIGAR